MPDSQENIMVRIIVRIFQIYILGFFLFLLCSAIAGQEKGVFWFVLITVTLLILTMVGKIVHRLR